MAANPIIICDPATSWYDFTYSLSWSNQCEVAELLSDIPFITVGIMVFASISALFFVVKRVSLSAVWLSFSALLSFVAAVLDLAKTLADEMAVNANPIATQPVIRWREALFAFSIGFRFLFYWTYVAEPPRKDLPAVSIQTVRETNFLILECTDKPHSGSWTRWGLLGKLLGAGSLIAIVSTTALQIVWRVVPKFHQYGNVYGTDAALELLVSFLLLLKLLSNTLTFNSRNDISPHTCMECLAPIFGILVKIAIGVGNLLCFAFTESTVGRLLQAFEVYIIAIFVTVSAFLRHRDILLSVTPLQSGKRGNILFTLPEPVRGSTFRVTPPLVETPRISMILGTIQNKTPSREMLRWSARRSLNHASSWVSSRITRNRVHSGDEEVRLWNGKKAAMDPSCVGNMTTEPVRSSVSSMQELGELLRGPSANVNHTSTISALDAQSALVRSMEGSIHSGQTLRPSRADVPHHMILLQSQTASFPDSSVPSTVPTRVKHTGNMVTNAEGSPVYGLSGIQALPSASNSRTSLDELLRQQDQLDRSIEALKLFPARMPTISNSASSSRSGELTRSSSIGQRTVSSEVSLSSFPTPPWLTIPVPPLPSPRPVTIKRTRGRRARFAAEQPTPVQDVHSVTPASAVNIQTPRFNSVPHSPLEEENESLSAEPGNSASVRSDDSGGTQYNVTSFIGDLATPGEPGQGGQEKAWWSRGSEPDGEAMQEASRMLTLPRRPDGPPASPAAAKLSPHIQAADHAEVAAPTTFQPGRVGDPPIAGTVKRTNRAQKTFVRPRPPPLVLQSYTEHNPGISQVQVLADN